MTHYCKSHTTTQSTRDTPRCEEAARKIAHSYICYDRCQQLLHDLPLPAQPGPICTRRLTHWHRPPIHRLLSGPIRRTSSSRPHSPRPRRPVHPVPSDSARQDASSRNVPNVRARGLGSHVQRIRWGERIRTHERATSDRRLGPCIIHMLGRPSVVQRCARQTELRP